MAYYVYIIQSKKTGRYYIGLTSDIEERLRHHNSGANKSTKGRGPWVLIHKELYKTKREAWERERQIKSYKGGEAFKKLIDGGVA
ncbi:MAG TPA: GIY-YIG nuclease family protein [Candidatus Tyrphobacter sp.]|nr:GIY-YIG nuclease family protein [Candidatus Tyrphobacter sp.]